MFGVTLSFFPAKNLHGFKVIFDANAKDRPSLFVHEDLARGEAVIAGKEGEKNAVEIGTARTIFGFLDYCKFLFSLEHSSYAEIKVRTRSNH